MMLAKLWLVDCLALRLLALTPRHRTPTARLLKMFTDRQLYDENEASTAASHWVFFVEAVVTYFHDRSVFEDYQPPRDRELDAPKVIDYDSVVGIRIDDVALDRLYREVPGWASEDEEDDEEEEDYDSEKTETEEELEEEKEKAKEKEDEDVEREAKRPKLD
jgi:hypothetical protein